MLFSRYNYHKTERGQAALEFCIMLLLLLIVVTGLLHISRLTRTSLFLAGTLRGMAGERAMQSGVLSASPAFIEDWSAGSDQIRYTADDRPLYNTLSLPATVGLLGGFSAAQPGDWVHVAPFSQLPFSMLRLHESPLPSTLLGTTHIKERLHVPVEGVIQQLVYDKESVAIEEEVWMPLMGGLY